MINRRKQRSIKKNIHWEKAISSLSEEINAVFGEADLYTARSNMGYVEFSLRRERVKLQFGRDSDGKGQFMFWHVNAPTEFRQNENLMPPLKSLAQYICSQPVRTIKQVFAVASVLHVLEPIVHNKEQNMNQAHSLEILIRKLPSATTMKLTPKYERMYTQ